jgi:hypothetical protein
MFSDNDLINHLKTKNSVSIDSLVIAEWNQNDFTNLENYGNYRFRPDGSDVVYRNIYPEYDPQDVVNSYTNALDSSYISEYKTEDPDEPVTFITKESDRESYYSLKDCIKPFRPRSGINKMLYFGESNINNTKFVDSFRSGRRPRYYFSSRFDNFKYWNSYRKESGQEFGISSQVATFFTTDNPSYKIKDCAPFVTYKNKVATNRIVVKMQTNLADPAAVGVNGDSLVPEEIRRNNSLIADPMKDISKSSVPKKWKIQYLNENNNWTDAIQFDETSTRRDGSIIVPWDGYVEVYYGIKIPERFRTNFNLYSYLDSFDQLPDTSLYNFSNNTKDGDAYIVGASSTDAGTLYVWSQEGEEWVDYDVEYGFSLLEDDDTKRLGLVKKILNPEYFNIEGTDIYREFVFIKGIRLVVETMYAPNKTFDLIEISPRLKVNITDYVLDYEITKNIMATDYGLPVGGLVASTGNISLSNHDGSFTELNVFDEEDKTGSIIANNLKPQIKFDFYEAVLNVNGYDKFIPLKTFYSENAAIATSGMEDISLDLRDAYFILESNKAAPIFLQNCTLTMAAALLLDNIGFSNYVFKNITSVNDPVIPFFFVEPDTSVSEILQRLAQSTQTAMFFDEYNNFVIMPKEYLMPDISIRDNNSAISERLTNLYGQKTDDFVPNIEAIAGFETNILNDGQINYTTRYIQREVSRLEQASLSLSERTYGYKSSILWELGDQKELRTINQPTANTGYALGAVTLNTSLPDFAPYVRNHQIVNNTIDVGESAFWLPRFQGYLYANGEIIRYDAQQYHVDAPSASATNGLVWITSNNEYQKYFSNLVFNGKMTLTGLLRIYTEPYYENASGSNFENLEENVRYKNGDVRSHGRGQFGTGIVNHFAGLNPYWEDPDNRRSFRMDSGNIYSTIPAKFFPNLELEVPITTIIPYEFYTDNEFVQGILNPRLSYGRGSEQHYIAKAMGYSDPLAYSVRAAEMVGVYRNLSPYRKNVITGMIIRANSSTQNVFGYMSGFNMTQISDEPPRYNYAMPLGDDPISKSQSLVHGKIANFMKQSTRTEGFSSYSQQDTAGIQSSALVFSGPYPVPSLANPVFNRIELSATTETDLVNYVYKSLDTDYTHVGTRMRIIGKQKDDDTQSALNSIKLFDIDQNSSTGGLNVKELSGGAGGIGYMLDPITNSGYYLEIASLSSDVLKEFTNSGSVSSGSVVSGSVSSGSVSYEPVIENIIFYKVENRPYLRQKTGKTNIAVPKKLWGSLARILVDEGKFIGSDRATSQEIPVYDLSLDVQISRNGSRISRIDFSIYLNNVLIGIVSDETPLQMPVDGLKTGLFTRGSSRCMFENIYALKNIKENDTPLLEKIDGAFSAESLRKYSLPAAIQRTYMSSIGTETRPTVDFYFEEFGTILRECAYFNIKYDQAYPALIAKIVPPFTVEKSYEISGFLPGSYGAEFLLFNTTDKAIDLSENSTNRIMIQGITFTQNISNVLTVDDYFKELSNFSDPVITENNLIISPERSEKIYDNIKNSRAIYGNKSFSLDSVYIQNEDSAKDVMKWILDKTIKPRKVFEIDTFGTSHIQLGDIVKIDFDLPEGVKLVDENKKFVVISATYNRSSSDVQSQLRLMEV